MEKYVEFIDTSEPPAPDGVDVYHAVSLDCDDIIAVAEMLRAHGIDRVYGRDPTHVSLDSDPHLIIHVPINTPAALKWGRACNVMKKFGWAVIRV